MRTKEMLSYILLAAVVISFSSCADNGKAEDRGSSETASAETVSAGENTEKTDDTHDEKVSEFQNITVETQKYENERLTFIYENESYTLPLSRDGFKDDIVYYPGLKLYSEQIINNKLGEKITAVLTVDEEMTEIKLCDVINQNGALLSNSGSVCTLTRKGGSVCELKDADRVLEADLNDLIVSQKSDYAETVEDVVYSGYLFKDGKFMINELFVAEYDENGEKSYEEYPNRDLPNFFGSVQAVSGGYAEILLTDKKTVCTVPTYYCEDELYEGQEVMITLDCYISLFGSGDNKTFDYAVIYTDPSEYNYRNIDFDTLAYAMADPNELGGFVYTATDEVNSE